MEQEAHLLIPHKRLENLILDMLAEDMEAEVAAVLLVAQAHKASSSSVMLVNFDKEE